jgi:hypothetical protein
MKFARGPRLVLNSFKKFDRGRWLRLKGWYKCVLN